MLKEKIATKISANHLTLKPGGTSFDVTVVNNSDDFATFQVELLADIAKNSVGDDWYTISPDVCTKKPPGDSTRFSVHIHDVPRRGFVGLMTLTVRVFSLELPASEESRQVVRLLVPGEGVPAPQLDLPNKQFNRYPGESFQIPVTLESFNQRTTQITLRIVGIDSAWFDYRHERDLQIPPTGKTKEFFECHIPSDLTLAASKRYIFSIEAIALDTPVVKVDGVLTLLPQGYIDFSCGELYYQDTDKPSFLPFRSQVVEQKCRLQFDNHSNLIQDVNVEVEHRDDIDNSEDNSKSSQISINNSSEEKESGEEQLNNNSNNNNSNNNKRHLNNNKQKFWQRFIYSEESLTAEILTPQTTLNLKEPALFELVLQHVRPWFGFPQRHLLKAKAIISDYRVEVHNDLQTLEVEVLPVIPTWLQLLLLVLLLLSGYYVGNWYFWYKQQHIAPVNSVIFNGLGKEVISASNDQTIRQWRVENNQIQPQGILASSDKAIRVISYRPVNNDRVAIGYENGEIQLLNLLSGKSSIPLVDKNQKDDRVFDLTFNKNSRYLFSGHGSGMVKQWNLTNGVHLSKRIQKQKQVGFAINSLAIVGQNENYLAIGGRYNQLVLWNLKTNHIKQINNNNGGQEDYILSLATVENNPDILVTSDNQSKIKIWNLRPCLEGVQTCELLDEWDTGTQAIRSVALSANGCYLASVGDDGSARLWSLNYLGERIDRQDNFGKVFHKSPQTLKSVDVISIRDKVLIVSAGKDKRVRLSEEIMTNSQCN
ncbi:MAG: hypothetical protein ACFB02_09710 [Mastigocoleus sp.]